MREAPKYPPAPPVAVQVDDHRMSITKCLLVPALVLALRLGPSAARHRVPGGQEQGYLWQGHPVWPLCPPGVPGLPRSPDADGDARLGVKVQADGVVQQQLRPTKVHEVRE